MVKQIDPRVKEEILSLIATGMSQTEAAKEFNISTRTIRKWLTEPGARENLENQQFAIRNHRVDKTDSEYLRIAEKLCRTNAKTCLELKTRLADLINRINLDDLDSRSTLKLFHQTIDAEIKVMNHWKDLKAYKEFIEETQIAQLLEKEMDV